MPVRTYPTSVETCGTEIQADAAEHGYTHVRLVAEGQFGGTGAKATLYAVPAEGGEGLVLDTNGGALWEEHTDADTWAASLAEYGINA